MKILFIGGTGTISTEATKRCASLGWDVTLLNRGRQSERLPDGLKINFIQADVNDEAGVASQIKNLTFDAVANFINFVPEQAERDVRLFSGRTNQYIFVSSASVYQKPLSNYKITEGTPLSNPYWEYSRNKIACEEVFMKAYRENGFPVTIVRPSHTYDIYSTPVGLHGANGSWQVVKRMLEGKKILVHGDGNSLWTMTHSRDFAKGFVGLVGNVRALGEAFHITSDESLTWNQIYKAYGNALGVEPKLYHAATDFICAFGPEFSGGLYGDKANTVVFDNSKIKAHVPGYRADIRFDIGIRESLKYFLGRPDKQKEDPAFDQFTESVIKKLEEAKKSFLNPSSV